VALPAGNTLTELDLMRFLLGELLSCHLPAAESLASDPVFEACSLEPPVGPLPAARLYLLQTLRC
jgi:hypothetical protein